MKQCLIALSTLVIMAFCSCSKGDGDPITQEFSINGSYTELDVEDAFDVTVSDAVSQITVTAGDRIMSKVKVEKIGNELKIYLKGWTISHGTMKVVLPYNPELTSLSLSGASDFTSAYALTGAKVELDLSGASDFHGSVMADELDLELSGASEATIDGVVNKLDLEISGSSSLEKKVVNSRYSLACTECECSISGSSSAYIHCDGTIRGSISGSSDLHFTGTAFTADCNTSGSSDIVHDVF